MNPEYFRTRLTFSEAEAFISGVARRLRPQMFAAYYVLDGIRKTLGAKDDCCPEFLKHDPIFDEEIGHAPEPTAQERAEMERAAEQFNAFFNRPKRKPQEQE